MAADPTSETLDQLRLRHRPAAAASDEYTRAGFAAHLQDAVLGDFLPWTIWWSRTDPLYVVVPAPRADAVAAREAGPAENAYGAFTVSALDTVLCETTPRVGTWLDTSDLTVAETVLAGAQPVRR
ncbi:hypothetical protein [Nocardia grenadensis]|uniref:hypothetical protein n=1 Tax=Nocardia grenadensis TaxID=931537 RepID=UPI003D74E05E